METTPKTIPTRTTLTLVIKNLLPDAAKNGILPWTTPPPQAFRHAKREKPRSCADHVIIILNLVKLSAILTAILPRQVAIVLPNRGHYRPSGGKLLNRRKDVRLRSQRSIRKAELVKLQRIRILTRVQSVEKLQKGKSFISIAIYLNCVMCIYI